MKSYASAQGLPSPGGHGVKICGLQKFACHEFLVSESSTSQATSKSAVYLQCCAWVPLLIVVTSECIQVFLWATPSKLVQNWWRRWLAWTYRRLADIFDWWCGLFLAAQCLVGKMTEM
eukprot:scaffold141927_cov29-Prasinocladus_malaysianus.AAC.1